MKKIFFMLFALCLAGWNLQAQESEYLEQGACGEELLYTIDTNYKLAFWPKSLGVGNNRDRVADMTCGMPDFLAPDEEQQVGPVVLEHAPWLQWAGKIRSVNLANLDNIGSYAFANMVNLRYVIVPEEISAFGSMPFYGCENLMALEMRRSTPPQAPDNALYIDVAGERIPAIIISEIAYRAYFSDALWGYSNLIVNQGTVLNALGEDTDLHWSIGESDSISQAIRLSIDNLDATQVLQIADSDPERPYPWNSDELADKIEDLVINDNISYIGQEAFFGLYNLKSVTFHGANHPLDSMHVEAFSTDAALWKFALGDPDDGPLTPPRIIGDLDDLENRFELWRDSTVLYVPDESTEGVKTIDAYKSHPFWGVIFNRINDRTVEVKEENNTIVLKWLPLENAQAYQLHIRIDGCEGEGCDTTVIFPATGPRGVIDWTKINEEIQFEGIAARRAPKEDGGGGLVLTISLNEDSGKEHNENVEANISGMEEGTDYVFYRDVVQNGKVIDALSKGGLIKVQQSTAVETVNEDRAEQSAQKILLHGQLFILHEGKMYNAQGQISR